LKLEPSSSQNENKMKTTNGDGRRRATTTGDGRPRAATGGDGGTIKTQPNFSLIFAFTFHLFSIDFGSTCGLKRDGLWLGCAAFNGLVGLTRSAKN